MDGERLLGEVKWFNDAKGFGFITAENGENVFAHFTAINRAGFRTLQEGEKVYFDMMEGPKGKQAGNITPQAEEEKYKQPEPKKAPRKPKEYKIEQWFDQLPKATKPNSKYGQLFAQLRDRPGKWGVLRVVKDNAKSCGLKAKLKVRFGAGFEFAERTVEGKLLLLARYKK